MEDKTGILDRILSDTPSFFKKLRNLGLALGAIGTAIVTAPVTLPAVVITAGGYFITAGLVAAGLSQTAKTDKKKD